MPASAKAEAQWRGATPRHRPRRSGPAGRLCRAARDERRGDHHAAPDRLRVDPVLVDLVLDGVRRREQGPVHRRQPVLVHRIGGRHDHGAGRRADPPVRDRPAARRRPPGLPVGDRQPARARDGGRARQPDQPHDARERPGHDGHRRRVRRHRPGLREVRVLRRVGNVGDHPAELGRVRHPAVRGAARARQEAVGDDAVHHQPDDRLLGVRLGAHRAVRGPAARHDVRLQHLARRPDRADQLGDVGGGVRGDRAAGVEGVDRRADVRLRLAVDHGGLSQSTTCRPGSRTPRPRRARWRRPCT